MNSILDIGIKVVIFIQNLGNWLLMPMDMITQLGSRYFFLLVAVWLYWCVNTEIGLRLALFMTISGSVNSALKIAFHGPRPYWYSNAVKAYAAEASFGIPSGHAQGAMVMWSTLAAWIKRPWAWLCAGLIIFFISISRLYLGVHFPTDVLAGWLIGILLVGSLYYLEKKTTPWFTRQTTTIQVLLVLLASFSFIGLGLIAIWITRDWQMPPVWLVNAARADGEIPSPISISSIITNAGSFFGIVVGVIWLRRSGGYAAGKGSGVQMAARYFLGLLVTATLWIGLKMILPGGASLLSYSLAYMSYTVIGAWLTGIAPLFFIKTGLAQRK